MTVSLSPRLMSLLLYDIIKEQICKKINICKRSVSLYIIGDWNFKSNPEWWIQSVNSNSLEIGIRNLDRPIFKLKLRKKHRNLQTFLQLCSIRSAYLGNCAFFSWSFSFKNVMKWFFLNLIIPKIKKRFPHLKRNNICYVWRLSLFSK